MWQALFPAHWLSLLKITLCSRADKIRSWWGLGDVGEGVWGQRRSCLPPSWTVTFFFPTKQLIASNSKFLLLHRKKNVTKTKNPTNTWLARTKR